MARKIGKDALEEKIEKAQEDVVRAKKKYDASTAMLKQLLAKRQAIRAEEVMAAIAKSIGDMRTSLIISTPMVAKNQKDNAS